MTSPTPSAFAPLKHRVFAVLWAATVLGNIGSFMRDVASSWLVTDLSASPAAVALMQAAATLPGFLLAIPAGVLSDILDRRKFLIVVQLFLGCVSLSLVFLASSGALTVSSLIGLTFLGGLGAALMGPVWQSIVPELVPRTDLKSAVALNSLGINISRALGPAVGGLLLASFGASVTYSADVASYILVIAALIWWQRAPHADDALSEGFFGAFRAGLRYARASRELHIVLFRAFLFFAFGSAVWAMLPLIARNLLGGDASFYGIMLGAVGAGAFAVVALLCHRVALPTGEADLIPSNHWPEPLVHAEVGPDRGPVLILIEYRIRPEDRAASHRVLKRLSAERRRDGAYGWGVTEDSADPERIVEWFMVASWAEHLRQHRRVSKADADLQTEVLAFHQGPAWPKVQHLLTL